MKDRLIHWFWFSRKINAGQYLWLKKKFGVKDITKNTERG